MIGDTHFYMVVLLIFSIFTTAIIVRYITLKEAAKNMIVYGSRRYHEICSSRKLRLSMYINIFLFVLVLWLAVNG